MKHTTSPHQSVLLNNDAFNFAKNLIIQLKIDCQEHNWSTEKPNSATQDQYIATHSMEQYSQWFLAKKAHDTQKPSKEDFEFPLGNFEKIFRSAVIAAKQRAAQYHHKEIEKAAAELLDLIDAAACKK